MTNAFNNPYAAPMLYGSMLSMYPPAGAMPGQSAAATTPAGALGMTPSQMGWMMLAAQSQMLGLGSGRLSGVRAGQNGPAGGRGPLPSNLKSGGSSTPGGLAARYFNRTTRATPNQQSYFNRQPQYFPRVGR
jgi:hypothetical protein